MPFWHEVGKLLGWASYSLVLCRCEASSSVWPCRAINTYVLDSMAWLAVTQDFVYFSKTLKIRSPAERLSALTKTAQ